MSSARNTGSVATAASDMTLLLIEIERLFLALVQGLAQPGRRRALQHLLQLLQQLPNRGAFDRLHRVDLGRHYPRRRRAADGRHVNDSAVADGIDLRQQLVLVAVLLEIAVELDCLDELVSLG